MPNFDAKDFYSLALKIANTFPNEAGYRTAVGRAYYACHLVGEDSTVQKGWFHPDHGATDHRGLSKVFRDHSLVSISDKLRELIELREHVDYHMSKSTTEHCSYCELVKGDSPLVDETTWKRAKALADDLLPRLESIKPSIK